MSERRAQLRKAAHALCSAGGAALAALFIASPALAQDAPPIDTGDTAWMLTSTALVLMMTIPGLALFYGGMVRKKNVLATVAQSFGATAVITVLWMIIGYSLAFTTNDNESANRFIGSMKYLFLKPMGLNATSALAPTIPESVYMTFQMTFAIITPALIAGALADRMKFSAFLTFMGAWLILVYAPIAHWVWGGGWLGQLGALDYAGGTVVHLNAGTAGLVTCLVLGKRTGYGTVNMAPHNLVLSLAGASLLVGRLVRLQCRFGGDLERQCRHGDGRDANRGGRGIACLDVRRMAGQQEAVRARHDLGRSGGARRDHAGLGLRRSVRRADRRNRGRRRLLLLLRLVEEGARL